RLGLRVERRPEDRKLPLGGVEDLSTAFGDRINKTYLFRVERGTTVPTLTRLHVLSRVYRVKLSTLVDVLERAQQEQKRAARSAIDVSKTSFEDLRRKGIDANHAG